ncbi:hypothetical protein ACFQZX_11515 [Mucilaginibacter litoreus]|uniref:SIR2-like domain-containing protein n=1 Tax=Mucilaginibacter litoreus TaxID=1048221 RepID=A0ABW3ATR6_9SPHI
MPTKTVFILDAGASVEAGAPVMTNFFDTTEDLYLSTKITDQTDRQSIQNIFELIKKSLSSYANSNIDLNNIETIFGLLEMASIVKELHDYDESKISQLRNDLIMLIVRTLEFSTNITPLYDGFTATKSYEQLLGYIKRTGLNNNTVITFNYDMAFEAAFSQLQSSDYIDYGFSYTKTKAHPREPFGFYKLHGSINWYEKNDGTTLEVLDITEIERFNVYKKYFQEKLSGRKKTFLSINELRRYISSYEHFQYLNYCSETPFIIPPSWNKSAYHKSVNFIWQKAVKAITEASNIVIIGYSLPESDLFFKYLFTLGTLNNSRIRSLSVYDPNPAIEENYRKMLGNGILNRFKFYQSTFAEAMSSLHSVANRNISIGW